MPPVLSLFAGGLDSAQNGRVEVHGSRGPWPPNRAARKPAVRKNPDINGVEIYTGDANNIRPDADSLPRANNT